MKSEIVEKAPELGRTRKFTGPMRWVVTTLAIAISIYHLLYTGGIFSMMGIYLQTGTHLGISLGLIMALLFLITPASKRSLRNQLPWYDVALIILSLVPTMYYGINYSKLIYRSFIATPFETYLGFVLVLVVLEAARRTVGLVLTIIGIVFLIYPFISQYLPGILYAGPRTFTRVMEVMYFYSGGIFGSAYGVIATVVIVYLIFGGFLDISGAGRFFINLALSLLGSFRGGPAKVAVVSSAFFSSISGSAVANVASTGVVTIPLMKSIGYKPHFAGAVESVASNGGPLTPPVMGAVAFIMADFLQVSYLTIVVAAILPAFLYYVALFVMVDMEAAKTGLKGLPREQVPSLRKVLREGWLYFLPLAILVYFLAVMRYSAETSCLYTIIAFVIVSWFKKDARLGPRQIAAALANGAKAMPSLAAAVAVAGIIMGALVSTGLSIGLSGALVNLFYGNRIGLLLVGTIFCLILGMGATTTAVYLISVVTIVPALTAVNIPPIVAHFFVLYMAQAALITPPVCLVAYVAAAIANANFWRVGLTAVRLGIVILILPFIFVYSPELLIVGSAGGIALAVITAMVGVVFLSLGLQGFFLRDVRWPGRVLLIAGGLALIIPGWLTDAIGLTGGLVPVVWQTIATRLVKAKLTA